MSGGAWKYQDKPLTPHESHNIRRDVSGTVPSRGYLDISEQLSSGQSEDVRVVAVLWCDGQCVRSQFAIEGVRARQHVGVIIEKHRDLWAVT